MITVKIGTAEVPIGDATEGWINQQISRRKADGGSVCVQVSIQEQDARVLLTTPTCARGAVGGRPPNTREARILELWRERGLDNADFTPGAVSAFLHQMRKLL